MKFHKDKTLPTRNEIFVFGSNLAGIHGAGAAKVALKFGARYGHGIGLYGLSNRCQVDQECRGIVTGKQIGRAHV